jgi:SAM-dependent methyltransferase
MAYNRIFEMNCLDIGCGARPYNVYGVDKLYGIDIIEIADLGYFKPRDWQNNPTGQTLAGYACADVSINSLPFPDMSFDRITAIDVLEHIPRVAYTPVRRFCFVELMSEIYRVLKPGGEFFSCTPFFPHKEAFSDPTHVNIVTPETFEYFKTTGAYGFKGEFLIKQISEVGCKLHVRLGKAVL